MNEHLNECVKLLQEKYGENRVVFVGYYGAHNYKLDTKSSDYDFKAIIIPSFEDIVLNKKAVSTTFNLSNGLCDVKDIRLMMNCWKKQNVNFIELLFTKYRWLNPEYEENFSLLFDNNESIAHYDELHAINCIKGMQMEKYHALFKPYPSQKDVIDKYGYAAKQLCHIWRLKDLVSKYVNGDSYANCLVPSETLRWLLIDIKEYRPVLTKEQVEASAKRAIDETINLLENYSIAPINEEINKLMNDVTTNIIKKALKREIYDL